jgi:5-(carboxyamino)imidazole ribonucleotide mutase
MEKGIPSVKIKVGIIMGSQSDAEVMIEAKKILNQFKIKAEVKIVSAHRTPHDMMTYAEGAEERGIKVIIAGAGGAAHLPGMVASFTVLPVIGVPIGGGTLKGLDSLLSIVQMPKGVPVATTAINGGYNAGLLALRLLAMEDSKLRATLHRYRRQLRSKVKQSRSSLRKLLR